MTVSIQIYRIQIGLFDVSRVSGKYKLRKNPTKESRSTAQALLLCFLLLWPTLYNLNPGLKLPKSKCLNNLNSASSFINSSSDIVMITNFIWRWPFSVLSLNSLNHALYGNRKRPGYKLAFWNCRKGLISGNHCDSAKMVDIKRFVSKHQPHVFGIIESDLHSINSRFNRRLVVSKSKIDEKLNIEGYNIELPSTWEQHGQARVLVYVSKDIHYKRVEAPSNMKDLPMVTLEIGFGKERKSIVSVFYREWTGGISGSNDSVAQEDRWRRQILFWKDLYNRNRDVVVMGDANLCSHKWNDNDYDSSKKTLASLIQDQLLEESCHQLVEGFTRSELVNGVVVQSLIDHVYTNVPTKCSKPILESAGDSDHLAVSLTKFTRELSYRPHTVLKRSYKNFDIGQFLQDILDSNINRKVLEQVHFEGAVEIFQSVFLKILDYHAPVHVFQTRKNYVPFLSEDMKRLMRERDVLKEEATKTGDPILMSEYRCKRNWIKENLAIEKEQYYKNKLFDEKLTLKRAWRVVHNILGQSKSNSPQRIKFNDKMISNPKGLAEAFNKIFQDKIKILRNQTDGNKPKIDPKSRLLSWLNGKNLSKFSLHVIDINKLRSIVKKIKPSRSHGSDFLDAYSIRLAFPLVEDAVLHLINLSISSNKFSDFWKTQLVLPLFKKNDPLDGSNYRPVAHIAELGKIVEYVIHDQVYQHFKDQQLFHTNHHGFLSNHSTASALIQLHDMLLSAAENKEFTAALLLDLSAAFDIVDHGILLEKLSVYNFDDNSIKWFQSYLGNRLQKVQVESKFSNEVELGPYGVPQGSVLGPLLFIIYCNDFAACCQEGESILYADDNTCLVSDGDPNRLHLKIQVEANRSADWAIDNKMVCAGNKTKLLIIGTEGLRKSRFQDQKMQINVCGISVQDTDSERLLGLVLNNNLTWKDYLYGESNSKGLLSQLSKRVGLLSKIAPLMPVHRFNQVCSGLFYSKLIYCIQVFGTVWDVKSHDESCRRSPAFTQEDNRKLQVIQNKVLRLKTGLPYDTPTKDLIKEAGDLSVQQLIAYTSLVTAQKSIINQEPAYLANKLKCSNRNANLILPPNYKLSVSRNGFFYRTAILLNNLPIDLQLRMDPKEFKRRAKAWIMENIPAKPSK